MKKSLKKQAVFPVLMLLVVTALALIGSSFAWFSMANTASLTEVTGTTEKGSVGLMISKDASTFTSSVTLDSGAATFVNPAFFHQVSTVNGINFFEATITEKNPDGTAAKIKTSADASVQVGTQCYGKYKNASNVLTLMTVSGAQYVIASSGAAAETSTTTGATANLASYMVFDLFFSVDAASDLYLDSGTSFTAGTAINAMRVAFLDYSSSANNASAAIALSTVEGTVIWDPHGDTSYFGVKEASGETEFTPYAAHSTVESVTTLASSSLFVDGTPWTDESTFTGYTSIATLAAGVNKLRVVVWLEGNDADCTATLAANKGIAFAMNFFAKAQ